MALTFPGTIAILTKDSLKTTSIRIRVTKMEWPNFIKNKAACSALPPSVLLTRQNVPAPDCEFTRTTLLNSQRPLMITITDALWRWVPFEIVVAWVSRKITSSPAGKRSDKKPLDHHHDHQYNRPSDYCPVMRLKMRVKFAYLNPF